MGKTLDNFGLGLSVVFALLYGHSFGGSDNQDLGGIAGLPNISINVITTYTVIVFLTQIFAFGNLIFSNHGKVTIVILRTIGWGLILVGYIFFLYLNGDVDIEALLRQPGGGINRIPID